MNIASTERAQLSDLFDQLGPDAPTLCEGWTTADLAAHLVIRENDPVAAAGIMVKPLAGHTEKKMTEVLARSPWAQVVDRVRRGPGRFSPFRIPGVDEGANAMEYFVHHEDVRRAQDGWTPRETTPEFEDFCFRRLRTMGKAMFRKVQVGLVLERNDHVELRPEHVHSTDPVRSTDPADSLRMRPGALTVTLVGRPSELLLFATGRGKHAEVTAVGSDSAIAELRRAPIGL